MTTAFTRRRFLQSSLVLASTATAVPALLQRAALARSSAQAGPATTGQPGALGAPILVVVQLSGGNDGLNAVVPFGCDEYYRARPTIAVPRRDVLPLDRGAGIGLHPELAGVRAMFDAGQVAIVQGVGYPNPNRSHFASMDIWHTADPSGSGTSSGKGLGWIGRALDAAPAQDDSLASCICVGAEPPLAAQGQLAAPLLLDRAGRAGAVGGDLGPAPASPYDQLHRTALVAGLGGTGATARAATAHPADDASRAIDRLRAAAQQTPLTAFPAGPLAHQLQTVAALIRAEIPTRVYCVSLGGFDTHAQQLARQPALLREFGTAMQAFYRELHALGAEHRVLTLAFSEFGRRVAENTSQGTDHGTAGPVFLFGAMLQPGLIGAHPDLARAQLDQGDLVYRTDFRSLYAAILDGWLGVDSRPVLGQAFAAAPVLNAPALA